MKINWHRIYRALLILVAVLAILVFINMFSGCNLRTYMGILS